MGGDRIPDEVRVLGDGRWSMWASVRPNGAFYEPGHRRYAQEFSREPVVPVIVTEREDGQYWGWLASDRDTPTMIHGHAAAFRMCFPYGPQAEVDRGHGRILRLVIEPYAA